MTKEELTDFCKKNDYEEVEKLAVLSGFNVPENNFTIMGGNIEYKENGKFITLGRFDNAAGLAKEYIFKEKK